MGRILSTRTNGWIRVIEKGKNGSWHLHIILALKEDFLDISGMKEQKSWQETLQKYKFGRVQLKKLSDPNGLARYLSKEFGNAELGNKVRRVGYSRGSRTVSLEFAWRGGKSQNIRSLFTERFGPDNGTLNLRDIYKAFLGGYLH